VLPACVCDGEHPVHSSYLRSVFSIFAEAKAGGAKSRKSGNRRSPVAGSVVGLWFTCTMDNRGADTIRSNSLTSNVFWNRRKTVQRYGLFLVPTWCQFAAIVPGFTGCAGC